MRVWSACAARPSTIAGTRADHQRRYPGGRHEMFNEVNKDDVLRDVTAFIDDILSADA